MNSLPRYQPSYIKSPQDLQHEIARLGLDLPISPRLEILQDPVQLGNRTAPNRFCALPIGSHDATKIGGPGPLATRRAVQAAEGGFGIIWIGAAAIEMVRRAGSGQHCISTESLSEFTHFVSRIKSAGKLQWDREPIVILQLTCTGSINEYTDGLLEEIRMQFAKASGNASRAGFDGVDISCAHRGLLASSLLAYDRAGRFGGSRENRFRLIREIHEEISTTVPDLLRVARMSVYDASESGFGVDAQDYRKPDVSEPVALARMLCDSGVSMILPSTASPNLQGDSDTRAASPLSSLDPPHEHTLTDIARRSELAQAIKDAVPELTLVSDGAMWLRQWWPQVAAGGIEAGPFDIAGMGRGAMAYPDAPSDLKAEGRMLEDKTCMACYACSELHLEGSTAGCVLRDPETYLARWQEVRRFHPDELLLEAERYRIENEAPGQEASPFPTDYATMLSAWAEGDKKRAWEVLRSTGLLPEMSATFSRISPEIESTSAEQNQGGIPIRLGELQQRLAKEAREAGWTGARIPAELYAQSIAVVGGGPCGIAAAVNLVERGYQVTLIERGNRLGGAPALVYSADRATEVEAEIEALVRPAIESKRLTLRLNTELGVHVEFDELKAAHDAVLLATGVWGENQIPLRHREDAEEGMITALEFLLQIREHEILEIQGPAVLLAGGDAAMDAARLAHQYGASPLTIVYEGPRSEMHWHMPESWFDTEGVQLMTRTKPVGLELDEDGAVTGLKVIPVAEDGSLREEVATVIDACICIDASGLTVDAESLKWVADPDAAVFSAGGMTNGGSFISRCVAEGMQAAESIHQFLNKS